MLQIDLENANKLKSCSSLLSNYADNIKTDKNNLDAQISNISLDTRDVTNEAICKKVEQIKFKIDGLTNVLVNMSSDAQVISARLTIMK